jgi:PPOX class probable F420-dependent enzyme
MIRVYSLLATARVIWLSSTRPDGRPHVVPTWFDWDGETITVFTRPDAQKVRNVRCQPKVMVAIGIADTTFEVELLEGEALVIDDTSAERGWRAGIGARSRRS